MDVIMDEFIDYLESKDLCFMGVYNYSEDTVK